ncbi:nucleotide exchange factor GrpE [Pedobacter flavus]|uniref:Protein GrpE n=1 Tax=Pedobacter flavus TaxID=3113906 RepID=A0ABU7H3Q5_9SPHI|nr:nucleotide exchange factor GrpE [Pedobacter sp. VNH31]MEE1885954.1 nucleotide exchange factor GrpE [Pedobacter sp. VNH31]
MFNKKKNKVKNEMNQEQEPLKENTIENTPVEENVTPEISVEEKLEQEKAELNDKFIRLFAEFDNYKRRTQKERVELLQTAGKDVIVSLLPVLDDFDRALKATEAEMDSPIREGVVLIHNKLNSILGQKGLKEIESNNADFDTDLHEALSNIPAPSEELKGKVIDTLEKGYMLNDKVIRFSKVVVGS